MGMQEEILAERRRQDCRWGAHHRPDNGTLLAVLTEEVGEVARCLTEGWPGFVDIRQMTVELVQVAAVAVAWVEILTREAEHAGAVAWVEILTREAEHAGV